MRFLRMTLLIVMTVLIQVALFPHLRVAGVVPDLGLVVALAVGYYEGPESGAIVGFAIGFGYDLFLVTPLGLSALSYALVGYGVGIIQGGLLRAPRVLPIALGFLAGLAGGLIFIGVGVLAGVDGVKGMHGVRVITYAAIYDALLAPFVFFLVSRLISRDDHVRSAWITR